MSPARSTTDVRARLECRFAGLNRTERHLMRLALNEAEGLAWQTGVPQLVLPELAMEKVEGIFAWLRRQQLISRRSGRLIPPASTPPAFPRPL